MKNVNNNKFCHTNNIDNLDIGLSIIPVSSEKRPFNSWKHYQTEQAPLSLWHSHYVNHGTVGVIMGKVSGNLECIDVDILNHPRQMIMTEYLELIPDDLLKRLIIQTTPNNGFHMIYRCPEVIEKSLELAKHSNENIIIETRGEGMYFCTNKLDNKIIHGKFDLEKLDIEIPVITSEERGLLFRCAGRLILSATVEKWFKEREPYIINNPWLMMS